MPVPLNGTSCGPPPPVSLIETEAERAPVAVGLNVTDKVQLPPAGTLVPQVLVCAKSPGFVPVTLIPVMLRLVVPTLVRVTVCGGLVVPTDTFPNARLAGTSFTFPTGIVMVAAADLVVSFADLAVSVTCGLVGIEAGAV